MVELTTGFAVLSLFLGWRLYVVNAKLMVANRMLIGMVTGKVKLTRTEDGFELEVKDNG